MDTPTGYGKLLVADDPAALARMAADHLFTWTMETSKPVRVALSGGSTPRRTYQELAGPRFIDRFPWRRVHWFWGDERFVPPDHPDSNFRMAREAMLDAAPAPPENIHPIPTVGLSPEESAAAYQLLLRNAYGEPHIVPGRALFDISLLGLGDDGHTASLLSGEPVLDERTHWVAAVAHGRPESRITLTYLSMAATNSPESSGRNSPLCCGSVSAVAARRFDGGEVIEVELDDLLERLCGGAVA